MEHEIKKSMKPTPPAPMSHQMDVPLASMLPNADNNLFCLARLAMIRALEIHDGNKPRIDHDPSDKATSIALREIAGGKVAFKQHVTSEKPSKET